ncbi:MAG: hypothetical protein ACLRWP_09625 [Bilophila wadsworthia]
MLEMDVAKSMAERIRKGDKPVVMHSIYQPQQPDCLKYLSEQGVPVFGAVDEAVRTMGVLVNTASAAPPFWKRPLPCRPSCPPDAGKRPKPSLPACVRKAASIWWKPKRVKCCVPTAWISPRIIWPLQPTKRRPCGKRSAARPS